MLTLQEKLTQKKEERAAKTKEMRDLNELALAEKRDLTEDENKTWDKLDKEERAMSEEIKRLERQIELNAREARNDFNRTQADKENRELNNYSFARAIRMAAGMESRDGLEEEMNQEAKKEARQMGEAVIGVGVPGMILSRSLTVGNSGAAMVETKQGGWIEALLDAFVLNDLGVDRMTGLSADFKLPKGAAFSAGFKAETAAQTDGSAAPGKVDVTAHRLPAVAYLAHKLMIQDGAGVNAYVDRSLKNAILIALQAAAINGAGGDAPTGILNTPGIGAVAIDTNGGALTRAKLLELRKKVAIENALKNNIAYLSNANVEAALMGIAIDAGSGKFLLEDEKVLGHRFVNTNTVPSNLTKGTGTDLSAVIFGDFSNLLIAQFGGMDLVVDEKSKAEEGLIKTVANTYWDAVVKEPKAFAAIVDALTA